MNSRLRLLFVIFAALLLVLSPGEGFPVGKAERKDFPEGEKPSNLAESSINKRLSDAIIGAQSTFKRSSTVADYGLHGEDIDYVLMEEMLNEYLTKNGGDLDRKLEEVEYDTIAGNYVKYIREQGQQWKKKDKDKATSSTLTVQHGSVKNTTVRTSTEKFDGSQTQRSDVVRTTKTTSDDGKPMSTTRAFFPVLWSPKTSTRQESLRNISTTSFNGQKSTTFRATKTSSAEYPGRLFTTKSTAVGAGTDNDHRWWVTPRPTGIPPPGDGRESLSWKVDSKGGHQVHVVVYFD